MQMECPLPLLHRVLSRNFSPKYFEGIKLKLEINCSKMAQSSISALIHKINFARIFLPKF